MAKGLLIILSGPSGVGKGTVRAKLFEDESLNLAYSISMTTREARPGEVNGRDYFFVDRETFEKKVAEGGLLEHAEFVGNYYGTPKDHVEELLNAGKNVLLEIEVQGALQVILERRIRGRRTESEEIVRQRLAKAEREIKTKDNYKHVVVNNTVDQAATDIAAIIKTQLQAAQ